ncbi:transcriptional regulator IFH1 [Iris pallida]|uniref:Transcriptional regulator IFH1 n=1 Tax=Iris pallida TaxID=29817 RepID=A0AAX6G4I4_IRIPA|nr:transcriptional regulator IFH1 [Iris pallida]
MAETSKELLDQPPKPSVLEGLLLGNKDPTAVPRTRLNKKLTVEKNGDGKPSPTTTQVQKSQVLGKVKDFLGLMAKANEKLVASAQGSSRANYDIEVLNGNEEEYIEMDLLLGVTDLHTAEAVAAAEASMGGTVQPSMSSGSSSSSDIEDETDEDSSDDHGDCNIGTSDSHDNKTNQTVHANKPPKIVVLN